MVGSVICAGSLDAQLLLGAADALRAHETNNSTEPAIMSTWRVRGPST